MKVRSWYGLSGEIKVENEQWHLVRIGNVALSHPPTVSLILRRGLPCADRLRLSYLHAFGHFQTLPFALAHTLFVAWDGRRQRSFMGWLMWLAALAVMYKTVWELTSEVYVVAAEGAAYRETYRKSPNRLLPLFWTAMSVVGIGLNGWLVRERRPAHLHIVRKGEA